MNACSGGAPGCFDFSSFLFFFCPGSCCSWIFTFLYFRVRLWGFSAASYPLLLQDTNDRLRFSHGVALGLSGTVGLFSALLAGHFSLISAAQGITLCDLNNCLTWISLFLDFVVCLDC